MSHYHLLPFTFSHISGREVLVNEVGDMLVAPVGTVASLTGRTIDCGSELYKSLSANFFVSERRVPELLDVLAERLAEKKCFMDEGTALHIFVLTLRCNQNCVYCQALSHDEQCRGKTMSLEALDEAVRLMFRSPARCLTMEFQGGEPSLEPALLSRAITLAEELNREARCELRYVLCTNCVRLTPQALDYPREIVDEYMRLGFHSIFLRALNPYGLASQNPDWTAYTDRFIDFYKTALDHIIEQNRGGYLLVEEFAAIILRKILTPWSTGFVDLQSPAGIVNSVLVYNYDGGVYASDESRMLAEQGDLYGHRPTSLLCRKNRAHNRTPHLAAH